MKKYVLILVSTILTSCLIFPFSFTFFPALNTKNMMVAVGLALYVFDLVDKKRFNAEKGTIRVFLASFAVSFMALFTMIYHNTSDATYVSFPLTLVYWLSASYVCLKVMKATHGYVSAGLVTKYMAAMSVAQCVVAILIDTFPAFEDFVCSWMVGGRDFWSRSGRMYGIGCGLDVAGVRFSAILVMISYLCYESSREKKGKQLFLLLVAFAIITVVGNMISRTTIVGVGAAVIIWMLLSIVSIKSKFTKVSSLWGYLILVIALVSGICTVLYHTDEKTRENLRFGFEGFFSIVEKGHWETHSNNQLKGMVKWPDNTATWILGDGYMLDPTDVEDYLVKNRSQGDYVYQGTDIGYCRFIFYFGIVGLAVMILYFAVAAGACAARAPSKRLAFFFLFVVTLVVWAKVTTDPFAVIAPFLLTDFETDETDEESEPEAEESTEDEYENRILHTLSL